ncbi:DNA replication complex GINS protein PSF2 isoform X2 [Capsella rubella]|uniref:DNA replication complex GINS protein PSF2 isoform X2 n=1 Tax=Capsella rubella TaxID=81985 RepID=UPI000CD4A23A|nr:DNA replication complex GINS protein PSF2 isoform X2 [Capsella rubella]
MAGQTDPHISLFSPQEIEFMAEDELVEIVPNMNMEQLNFISIPTKVPLWLAVALKRRGKCTFRPPGWMSVDNLTQILEAERESQSTFQALPFSYVEIARLLIDHARDDIPDMFMVRSLVEDIRDVRLHKLETNLGSFQGTSAVKISNVSAMEVNIVRPFVRRALEAFYKHDKPEADVDRDTRSSRQQREANNEPRRPLRQR